MKDLINPRLQVDDRIVLIAMPGENAVTYGDRGTVTKVNDARSFIQYSINWDNGSTLAIIEDIGDTSNTVDKWMKEDDFDRIIKKRRLKESDDVGKKIMDSRFVYTKFDWQFLFSFLEKLRESGITNMFAAAPYLYMGKERISHEGKYNENKDDDAFDELVEMAGETRDKMIQGAIKVIEKQGKEISVERISRVMREYSQKVLDMWMTTYNWR